jgi:hypothetical protein
VDWLHWKTIDWAATGTMLQGIGAVIGAIAVIVAAIVGRNTFQAWRRQQIVQRHMELAERILTTAVRAKDQVRAIRSPLKTASELVSAEKTLESNNFDKKSFSQEAWRNFQISQATHDRLNNCASTWSELEALKPSAYVYFGDNVSSSIETILHQVHIIRVDADAYAVDTGRDPDFSRKLRETLSFSRTGDRKDELADKMNNAVEIIQSELQPLLRDVADAANKAVKEFVVDILRSSVRINLP